MHQMLEECQTMASVYGVGPKIENNIGSYADCTRFRLGALIISQ